MKIMLVMFICSAAAQNCIPPITSPELFKDEYSCMMAGYEESGKKIAEIGRKEVNTHDIYIKFECHPYKITLPKIQPVIDS